MKIVGIAVLMMGLLIGLSLIMDILQGSGISTALRNVFSPFHAMESAEWFVLFLFIFLLVIEYMLQKRKEKTKQPKKQSQP
jgi:divalent metal cation (Fe/Co/Zn/Cd) transporter